MEVGTRERLIAVAGVTVAEAPTTYLWLRLDQAGHEWWGLLSLSAGLLLETVVAGKLIQRQRDNGIIPGARSVPGSDYQKKVGRLIGATTVAEIGLWVLWLALAEGTSQVVGAVVLLVLMHLKHHVEFVAARDTPFPERILAPRSTFASAMEVAGGVTCLALLLDGKPALAAVALLAGFLVEHTILVDELQSELERRDIRLPRSAAS
jgi:hypothetical protein